MLLGYHLLWSTTARIVGTKEQQERTERLILENNYFIGGKSSTVHHKLPIRVLIKVDLQAL